MLAFLYCTHALANRSFSRGLESPNPAASARFGARNSSGSRCPRIAGRLFAVGMSLWSLAAQAQLELVPDSASQSVFADGARKITVVLRNNGEQPLDVDLRARLYQTSSATAALWAEEPVKKLRVWPGQTLIESASLTFPAVKAETRFLVQWLNSTNKLAGPTGVLVCPPDLLKELKSLAGEEPPGVFDPDNQLKPLLQGLGVRFLDLQEDGMENFPGRLVVVGPFESRAQMKRESAEQIKALAKQGAAVLWMQAPADRDWRLRPSFYTVPEGAGRIVMVQSALVPHLPDNPQSQLNLIQLVRLALHPEPERLPTTQPYSGVYGIQDPAR